MSSPIIDTYRYHPIDKYYTGKTIRQIAPGIYPPLNTTDIKPPKVREGYVQVFDEKENKWNVVPDTFDRSKIIQHVLIRPSCLYNKPTIPYIYSRSLNQPLLEDQYIAICNFFSQLNSLNNFESSFAAAISFATRLNHINQRIQELFQNQYWYFLHLNFYKYGTLGKNIEQQILTEEIIHQIKRLLDLLAITVAANDYSIEHNIKQYRSNHRMPVDNYTQLWARGASNTTRKKLGVDNHMHLLQFINNLHNAYKHDLLAEQGSDSLTQEPYIQTPKFKNPRTNLNEIHVFECSVRALIMACDEYISAVINQNASTLKPSYGITEQCIGKL